MLQTHSLKKRAIHAGIWTLGGHVAGQSVRLASNLIMTRLLVPEMFGVMAIVYVIMVGLILFTDTGLRQSIIQNKRGDDPVFLNTVWSVQIIRGLVLWVMSLLVALLLYWANQSGFVPDNTVYANALLPWIIPVACLAVLIAGFEPTFVATASRHLRQSTVTMIEFACQIVSVLVMLIWAYFDRSIWVLVAGGLSVGITRNLIIYYMVWDKRNKWMLERESLKEIIHFGKWIFASSIAGFLIMNGDRLLLGGLISAEQLGIYAIAFFIVTSLTSVVNQLLGNVAFPALSEAFRLRPDDLASVYYRLRIRIDSALLFFAGFLFISGSAIVQILYDARYQSAGQMIEVLAFTLIAVRYSLSEQCFVAIGKPSIMTVSIIIRGIALFVLLPLAFLKFGIAGALWALVASSLSSVPVTLYYKHKLKLLNIYDEIITLPIFLIGLVAGYIFNIIAGQQ